MVEVVRSRMTGCGGCVLLTVMALSPLARAPRTSLLLLTALALCLVSGAAIVTAQQPEAAAESLPKIWQGVYTNEQAAHGREVVVRHCSFCHEEDLTGGDGPPLVGGSFVRNWGNRYLDRLYRKIRETMPPGEETVVTPADKLAALAYILKTNGFPAGQVELPLSASELRAIQVVGPKGPEPAPTGALVEVRGCLDLDGTRWRITHAPDPEVSTIDDPKGDAAAAKGLPLGSGTVYLLDVFQAPTALRGQNVMAKGLLIRNPDETRLNMLAIEQVAPSCP